MTDALIRLECPACPGVPMERTVIGSGVAIRHCTRCGGAWVLRGQGPALAAVLAPTLRTILRREPGASFVCHACHAPMDRGAPACPACGWDNRLPCPDCGRTMQRQEHRGITVDVCRACVGVWMDHGELGALWTVRPGGERQGVVATAGDAAGFVLESVWYAPDLAVGAAHLTAHAAVGAVEAAAHAPELLSAAAEGAGSVFGLIAEVLGSLFDF